MDVQGVRGSVQLGGYNGHNDDIVHRYFDNKRNKYNFHERDDQHDGNDFDVNNVHHNPRHYFNFQLVVQHSDFFNEQHINNKYYNHDVFVEQYFFNTVVDDECHVELQHHHEIHVDDCHVEHQHDINHYRLEHID